VTQKRAYTLNISKTVDTYQSPDDEERYARKTSMDKIEKMIPISIFHVI